MSPLTKLVSPWRRSAEPPSNFGGAKTCAFRVNSAGDVLDQSPTAASLVALWASDHGPLHEVVAEALQSGMPIDARFEDEAGARYWLVAVPQGNECVVVTRDTTLPDKVTEALLKSRSMLKELLDSAADMAFEVDRNQRLLFVSPSETFGFKTESWLGENVTSLFWPEGNTPSRNPFVSAVVARFDGVPVQFEGQERRWLHFTVHPQFDNTGAFSGLRGTCRDMTSRFKAERKAKQDSIRFMLLQRITKSLNNSDNAQALMDNAAEALLEVMRSDMVWTAVKYREGLVPVSVSGSYLGIVDLDSIWLSLSNASGVATLVKDHEREHLAIRLELGEDSLGMVLISRDTAVSPWSEQEMQLLDGVADVLTAAFGKAQLIDRLYRLSSKDDLTGLLNRRAMADTTEARLKHQARTGLSGCLVFIDLDHFKEVNDTLGHQAGDEALRHVATHLQNMIRPCDYAGRYGGDEFVLWLEDVDAEDAARKAQSLIGGPALKLNASIGVCQSLVGADLSFDELAAKADAALYEVKGSGRGAVAIARPEPVLGEEN